MSIFLLLKHIIKSKDPIHINSFNEDINYNQIKKLWLNFQENNKSDNKIKETFIKIKRLGDLTNDIAYLNVYSKKGEKDMFGLYYCKGISKYLKINSVNIKKILDSDISENNYFVLTYLIKLK